MARQFKFVSSRCDSCGPSRLDEPTEVREHVRSMCDGNHIEDVLTTYTGSITCDLRETGRSRNEHEISEGQRELSSSAMYVRGAYAEDRKTGNPQKSVLRERGSASCGMNTCNPRLQDCWGGFSNDTGCSRWWRVRNVRLLYLYSMAVRCVEYHQHGMDLLVPSWEIYVP